MSTTCSSGGEAASRIEFAKLTKSSYKYQSRAAFLILPVLTQTLNRSTPMPPRKRRASSPLQPTDSTVMWRWIKRITSRFEFEPPCTP